LRITQSGATGMSLPFPRSYNGLPSASRC
jgi:hypothetical protein